MTPWLPCRFPAEAGHDRERVSRAAGQRLTPTPARIEWTYLDWSQLSVRKLRKIVGFRFQNESSQPSDDSIWNRNMAEDEMCPLDSPNPPHQGGREYEGEIV